MWTFLVVFSFLVYSIWVESKIPNFKIDKCFWIVYAQYWQDLEVNDNLKWDLLVTKGHYANASILKIKDAWFDNWKVDLL
jgi:hypothetical protein